MEKLCSAFEVKSVSEQGTFSGYGSVWNVQDYYDDVVVRGAFGRSLAEHKSAGTAPALLWQHDAEKPIGIYTSMVEDDHGLYVEGKLALKTQQGAEAHELMKMGALTGLSIGFVTKAYEIDKDKGIRIVKDVDLWEVSPVSFPANTKARVEAVKGTTDPRELERRLRDVLGLTQSQAKRLVAAIGPREVSGEKPTEASVGEDLISMMRKLRIGG